MNGVVLGVDRQQRDVLLARSRREDLSRGHHGFFVGEADGLAGLDRCIRGFESRDANDGRNHEVHFGQRGDAHGAFAAPDHFDAGDALFAQPPRKVGGQFLGGQRNHARTPPKALLESAINVAPGCERGDREPLRVGRNNAERALPDGAGRSQNGDAFHRRSFAFVLAESAAPKPRSGWLFMNKLTKHPAQKDCCAN